MTPQAALAMKSSPDPQCPDFSLVLGGPLFQFYRRAHLSGSALELLGRRILFVTLLAWLPLVILAWLDGHLLTDSLRMPFLHDIEANARFLIALPALMAGEVLVHLCMSPLVRNFVERGIVAPEDQPKLNVAVNSAMRVRDSAVVELALLFLVYTLGVWFWRNQLTAGEATWHAIPGTGSRLTSAGYWYAFVSIPIFQFIVLRWYVRLVLWFRLLWHISRLRLNLNAVHPDRAGGLGFLGRFSTSFAPVLFAQGVLLSGFIANRVLYGGRSLMSFKVETIGFVGFFVLFILAPLTMFSSRLAYAKWMGAEEYGLLATRYVSGFKKKWIGSSSLETKDLLGTPDLQALADLMNSYSTISRMHLAPIKGREVAELAIATAAPLLPLLLIVFSPRELLDFMVRIIFR